MTIDVPSDRQIRIHDDLVGIREDTVMQGDVYVEYPTPPHVDGLGEPGIKFWQSQQRQSRGR